MRTTSLLLIRQTSLYANKDSQFDEILETANLKHPCQAFTKKQRK